MSRDFTFIDDVIDALILLIDIEVIQLHEQKHIMLRVMQIIKL